MASEWRTLRQGAERINPRGFAFCAPAQRLTPFPTSSCNSLFQGSCQNIRDWGGRLLDALDAKLDQIFPRKHQLP